MSQTQSPTDPDVEMPVLHLYAQRLWHDDLTIVGCRDALQELRSLIGQALASNNSASAEFFASDGEGYVAHVVILPADRAQALPVPYTDPIAEAPPFDLARILAQPSSLKAHPGEPS